MLQPTIERKTTIEKVIYSVQVFAYSGAEDFDGYREQRSCRIEIRAGSEQELHDFIMASNGLVADPIKREVVESYTFEEGGVEAQVLEVYFAGGELHKIAAIKRYRELTGLGLKESKDAVEEIIARHNVYDYKLSDKEPRDLHGLPRF